MMSDDLFSVALALSATLAIAAALPIYLFGRRGIGLERGGAFLFAVATMLGSVGASVWEVRYVMPYLNHLHISDRPEALAMDVCSASILVLAGFPLVAKFYKAWICGEMTEAERTPGFAGLRTWLSPAKIVTGIVAAVCASNVFFYPLPAMLGLVAVLLTAYPAVNILCRQQEEPSTEKEIDNLRAEREKVLSMLDAGKITAEESAELLNALRQSSVAPPKRAIARPQMRPAIVVGAAVVTVGFFLP